MEGGDGGLGASHQAWFAACALQQQGAPEESRPSSAGSLCSAGSTGYWTATSAGGSSAGGSVHGGSARFSGASLDAALRRGGLGSTAGACTATRHACGVVCCRMFRARAGVTAALPARWPTQPALPPCIAV